MNQFDHLTKRDLALGAAEQIKHANLSNIPFGGHAVHVDEPEVFMLTLNEFLNQ